MPSLLAENTEPTAHSLVDELIEQPVLSPRLSRALAELALRREISWDEARYVLGAVECFDRAREDLIELVAARRFVFYRMLGGTELSLAMFTATVRHELLTGEHI